MIDICPFVHKSLRSARPSRYFRSLKNYSI